MAEPPDSIMEIKEQLMVSPKGGKPTSKMSHFIKPIINFSDKTPELPKITLPSRPVMQNCTLNGWRDPSQQWISWVDELHSSYKMIWKSAGIYDAILSSRYKITKNQDLFFGLAERWCCETNTFVFSWGEATITLEDVMILGGYSVLGDSVYGNYANKETAKIEEKLLKIHEKKGNQEQWIKYFKGSESDIEHEAFLALWLSRFVLPTYPFDMIVQRFFKIAICLARGVKIALAPVVLASIYKDLSLLNSVMQSSVQGKEFGKGGDFDDDLFMVTLWAPLQLVQVWAWERFPAFRPKPRVIEYGEPRLGRWHLVNEEDIGNVRPMLQSVGDSFQWRPYCIGVTNWPMPGFYIENDRWFLVNDDLDEDFRAMAHCLRVTELVSLDSLEQYNPHRVAMQFGFDQDVPKSVKRGLLGGGITKKDLLKLAWLSYMEPVRQKLFHLPSKSYEPQVTLRYLKWIRDGTLTRAAVIEGVVRLPRAKRVKRLQPLRLLFDSDDDEVDEALVIRPRSIVSHLVDARPDFERMSGGTNLDVPPGISPKLNAPGNVADVPPGFVSKKDAGHGSYVPPGFMPKKVGHNVDMPPGFPRKSALLMKADVVTKKGHSLQPIVRVKEELVEAMANSKSLASSGLQIDHNKLANIVSEKLKTSLTASGNRSGKDSKAVPESCHDIDVPPGFVPKKHGNNLDVPPGFQAKSTELMKSDSISKQGSFLETTVEVKKQCVNTTGAGELLLMSSFQSVHKSPHGIVPNRVKNPTTLMGNASGKCNEMVQGCAAGREPVTKANAPYVSPGRGAGSLGIDSCGHGSVRLDVEARISQLQKKIAALKELK